MTTTNWIDTFNSQDPEADPQTIEFIRNHIAQVMENGDTMPEAKQSLRDAYFKLTEGLSVSENTSLLMLQGRHRDALDNHLKDLDLDDDKSFELLCLLDMENFRRRDLKP